MAPIVASVVACGRRPVLLSWRFVLHSRTAAQPHSRTAAQPHSRTAAQTALTRAGCWLQGPPAISTVHCVMTVCAAQPHSRTAAQPHSRTAAQPHSRTAAQSPSTREQCCFKCLHRGRIVPVPVPVPVPTPPCRAIPGSDRIHHLGHPSLRRPRRRETFTPRGGNRGIFVQEPANQRVHTRSAEHGSGARPCEGVSVDPESDVGLARRPRRRHVPSMRPRKLPLPAARLTAEPAPSPASIGA
jgi:hypothetical protein